MYPRHSLKCEEIGLQKRPTYDPDSKTATGLAKNGAKGPTRRFVGWQETF